MKKIQLLFMFIVLLAFGAVAQNLANDEESFFRDNDTTITFRFANAELLTAPDRLQFDIQVKSNVPGTYHRDMQIYFDYSTLGFGTNIRTNNKITVLKRGITVGTFGGVQKYNIINIADNTPSRVAFFTATGFEAAPPSAVTHNEVPTDFTDFARVRIEIADPSQLAGIQFVGSINGTTFMDGGQYYQNTCMVWDPDIEEWVPAGCPRAYADPNVYDNDLLNEPLGAIPPTIFDLSGGGSYCEGSTPTGTWILLSGSQQGAIYQIYKDAMPYLEAINGTGGQIYRTNVPAGVYTMDATYQGITLMMNGTATITEIPLPVVGCPANMDVCITATPFTLTGATPTGGVYTGNGVVNNVFDPSLAGTGPHVITYTYADTRIAVWDFEGDVITPSFGSGTASLHGGTTSTFATGNGGGRGWNTTTYPAQSAGSGTRGVQFMLSTLGYSDIMLSFDHRASGTASRWVEVQYTLNGGTSWDVLSNNDGALSPHDTFYPFTFDFSSITGANNNPAFGLRIVSIFSPLAFNQNATLSYDANVAYMRANTDAKYPPDAGLGTGNYGTSGTMRFDNVMVTGTPSTFCSASCEFTITVHEVPELSCPFYEPVYVTADPFLLTGASPEGGVYSGLGVSDGIFSPSVAGIGEHLITYTYTDEYCGLLSCQFTIVVEEEPILCEDAVIINWPANLEFLCQGNEFSFASIEVLNAVNTIWTIDPPAAGQMIGNVFQTNLSYTGIVSVSLLAEAAEGCEDAWAEWFTNIMSVPATPTCPADFEICIDASPLALLGGEPGGGEYMGTGVADNIFYPSVAGTGTHMISYRVYNECGWSSCDFTATVVALPQLTCPEDMLVYTNTPAFLLTGENPLGGTYFGTGVVGTNQFDPAIAGIGEHVIYYQYNDPVCGFFECNFTITVQVPLYNVTFNVDLTGVTLTDLDDIYLSGGFPDQFWPMPGTDPSLQMFPVVPGSMIYTITLQLPVGYWEYKYFRVYNDIATWNLGEWDGWPNRAFNVVDQDVVLNDIWGVLGEMIECPSQFELCYNAEPVVLTGATPTGGYYAGDGVYFDNGTYQFMFDPSLVGYDGWHQLSYHAANQVCYFWVYVTGPPATECPPDIWACIDNPPFYHYDQLIEPQVLGAGIHEFNYVQTNECSVFSCTFTVTIIALPEPPVCPEDFEICVNAEPFFLGEGEFTGYGVINGYFYPEQVGADNESVITSWANNDCGSTSCDFTINVLGLPEIECPENMVVCINDEPFMVNGATFNPALAGPGVHEITLSLSNDCGTSECIFTITVIDLPTIECPEDMEVCINAGVLFFGDVEFDPAEAGAGVHPVTLTASNDCGETSCTFYITVIGLPEPPVCPPDLEVCYNEEPFEYGGYYIDPAYYGVGNIIFSLSTSNQCGSESCEFMVTILPIPEISDLPEYGPYCAGDPVVELTGMGVYTYNGNVITGFNPVDDGEFTLTYTVTNEFECAVSQDLIIFVYPLPVITDLPVYEPVCEGDSPIILLGSGTYTFEGEVITEFVPVEPGYFTLTYTITNGGGCSVSAPVSIEVMILPDAPECPEFEPVCEAAGYIAFTGDGVYTMDGQVVQGFEPIVAGTYEFNYTVSNGQCYISCEFAIVVNPLPVITNVPEYGPFCEGDAPVMLTGQGTYMLDGDVVTQFNPSDPGLFTLTYIVTNAFECAVSVPVEIMVYELPPVPECPEYEPVCIGSAYITFPNDGVYTYNGQPVTGFNPVSAGTFEFVYTITNGYCYSSCMFSIIVLPLPVLTCPNYVPVYYTDDDPIALSLVTPTGGTYSGPGVQNNMLQPATLAVGFYTLQYDYTDPETGCSNTCSFQIEVKLNGFIIAGYVITSNGGVIPNTLITFSNGGGTAMTNVAGYYEKFFAVGYTGVATPSKPGYLFVPDSRTYVDVNTNQFSQNYIGALANTMLTISGRVTNINGAGVSMTKITFSAVGYVLTNTLGYYTYQVPFGYTGTATPLRGGYIFNPANRTYATLTSNLTNQNFQSTNKSLEIDLYEQPGVLEVMAFPNPTTDLLNVEFNASSYTDIKLSLVNALGIEVKGFNFESLADNTIQIGMGDLKPGLYFLRVMTNNQTIVKRITLVK